MMIAMMMMNIQQFYIYTSQIHTLHINSPSLSRVSLALRPPLRKFTARLRVFLCEAEFLVGNGWVFCTVWVGLGKVTFYGKTVNYFSEYDARLNFKDFLLNFYNFLQFVSNFISN